MAQAIIDAMKTDAAQAANAQASAAAGYHYRASLDTAVGLQPPGTHAPRRYHFIFLKNI